MERETQMEQRADSNATGSTPRSRWGALVTYCSPSKVESRLRQLLKGGVVRFYAFATHDKDRNSDGEIKSAHTHVVVNTASSCRQTAFRKLFDGCDGNQNTLANVITVEYVRDRLRYLTHEDEDETKEHYPLDIVHTSDEKRFGKLSNDYVPLGEHEDTVQMLDDILVCSHREFALRYGRDGVINYHRYKEYACAMHGIVYDENM